MNPFPPALPPPVKPARPAALMVFGILNIIFGVIGLIGSVMSYKLYFTPLEHQTGLMADLLRHDPFYASCMRIIIVPAFVFVTAQLISGIGLLKAREGARRVAIYCGIYGILSGIVVGWLTMEHVLPFTTEMVVKTVKDPAVAEVTRAMSKVSGVIGLAAGLLYPVLTLIFLGRKPVRDYCLAEAGKAAV